MGGRPLLLVGGEGVAGGGVNTMEGEVTGLLNGDRVLGGDGVADLPLRPLLLLGGGVDTPGSVSSTESEGARVIFLRGRPGFLLCGTEDVGCDVGIVGEIGKAVNKAIEGIDAATDSTIVEEAK